MVDLIETSAQPDGVVLEVACFDSEGLRIFEELEKALVVNALFHFLGVREDDVTVLVPVVVDDLQVKVLGDVYGGFLK